MDYGPVTNDSIVANGRACQNWQIKVHFQQAVIIPVTLRRKSGNSISDPYDHVTPYKERCKEVKYA